MSESYSGAFGLTKPIKIEYEQNDKFEEGLLIGIYCKGYSPHLEAILFDKDGILTVKEVGRTSRIRKMNELGIGL